MLALRLSTALFSREVSTGAANVGTLLRSRLLRVDVGSHTENRQTLGQKGASGIGRGSLRSPLGQFATCTSFGLLLSIMLPAATESAIANGDTRTLNLYNQHTKESISATYRVNGHYDPAVLEKLNWFLRDWRRNEATHMDPRLFDVVWETYREAGVTKPIVIVCGYRSPETNAMLRRRSRAVARHSQHILGKAMDTEMPGISMEKVREIAMRLEMGGVGFYGDSSFVHIDVGGVRYWPRMTYAQLMRVFPDGKTVLIPTNGQPLPGYEEARAELAASGRAAQVPPSEKGQNFFAWLLGLARGGADEHEEEAAQSVAMQHAAEPTRTAEAEDAKPATATTGSATKEVAETADDDDRFAPAPPPRPTDFLALADVPLPPDRPAGASLATRASARKATSDGSVLAIKSGKAGSAIAASGDLPTIITHGASESALARQEQDALRGSVPALAYAPMAHLQGLRALAQSKASARLEQVAWAAAAAKIPAPSGAEITTLQRQLMISPTLTGLRQAARIETAALSHKLAAGYLARFASAATNLPTAYFSGPAVVGLRTADRSHMLFVNSSAAKTSD